MGFGRYKWYQSPILGDVSARRLSPEGGWPQNGVPTKTLGFEGEWIGVSHIDWRRKRVPAWVMCQRGG